MYARLGFLRLLSRHYKFLARFSDQLAGGSCAVICIGMRGWGRLKANQRASANGRTSSLTGFFQAAAAESVFRQIVKFS